jgi:adenylate cyclase 9
VKFDVWSNDVSFANKMESTGSPDLVHISEETKKFLNHDSYIFREADEVDGHKTFFILGKKNSASTPSEHTASCHQKFELNVNHHNTNRLKNLSTNDIPTMGPSPMSPTTTTNQTPNIPQIHHQSKSLSPSPVLNTRKHRLASISETVSKFLSAAKSSAANTEQQKSLLDQRRCQPNPTIVIGGISEEATHNADGTKISNLNNENESLMAITAATETTTNNSVINNISSNNIDCDKLNNKHVPYNGSGSSYQQIPLLTTSAATASQASDVEMNMEKDSDDEDGSSLNITDLRSYISQSRCDVSPFSRTGSNRSDRTHLSRHHHHNYHHHQRSNSQQSSLSPWYPPQEYAINLSPSRKDSGIKSNNSRRSSIQFNYKNSLIATNRVSGYFTSSQSSLAPDTQMDEMMMMKHMPSPMSGNAQVPPGNETLKACVQHLRKQSDLQLIKCVRDNARSQRSYLVKPPIRKLSLSFESSMMEKNFRNKAHRYESDNEMTASTFTLATPKFNTFTDVLVLTLTFAMVALSLFLLSPSIYSKEYKVWVCCFVVFSSIISLVLFLCVKQLFRRPRRTRNFNSIFGWASRYYWWNLFGSFFISLPIVSILINFTLVDVKKFPTIQFYYGLLLIVCLIHFCNFIQLNSWSKNIIAICSSVMFVFIGYNHREISKALNSNYQNDWMRSFNTSVIENKAPWFKNYEVELCLDLALVLILVFLLNREYEIGYRLSFYGNEVASQDKIKVQNMKNQADLLLHNIIPKHVADELKNTAKYSKNHQDVGILFASIVNFNEMYDESYLGGKEYLRVLNELIAGKNFNLFFRKS